MAVGTLTVLRVPPPRRVDPQVAGRAMLLAPLAVLPLGAAVTGLLLVTAETGVPPLARGLLAVALLALGTRALHLSWTYYRIHGTHDTRKIGRRSSNGCIGLYNEHIEQLYEMAYVGTQVLLI